MSLPSSFSLAVGSDPIARKERRWPPPIVDGVRLICQVFAGALLRHKHERALRATLAEVEALRERLQSENEYLRAGASSSEGFEDVVGESAALQSVLFLVEGGARTLRDVEQEHILRTLESCDWRVKGKGNAATQLGLKASTLHSRMKKLGIRRPAPGRRS